MIVEELECIINRLFVNFCAMYGRIPPFIAGFTLIMEFANLTFYI